MEMPPQVQFDSFVMGDGVAAHPDSDVSDWLSQDPGWPLPGIGELLTQIYQEANLPRDEILGHLEERRTTFLDERFYKWILGSICHR